MPSRVSYRGRGIVPKTGEGHPWVGDMAAFLVGSVGFLEFQLIGRVFGTEVLLLLGLIYLLTRNTKSLQEPRTRTILLLAVVWLIGQIATDLYRHSIPEDYLRGWSNIVFFALDFVALSLLLRTDRRILLYTAGYILSTLLKYYVVPDPEVAKDPWKWGLAVPCTLTLVLLATQQTAGEKKQLATILLLIGSALNVSFNYRSLALICFATMCLVVLGARGTVPLRPFQLAMGFGTVALGLWCFQQVYVYAVLSGALGREALQKHESQSAGELGLILGGRSEILASVRAIVDSPLIGHGSWARDSRYSDMLYGELSTRGYKVHAETDDLIPSHSHILGSWVYAGVLGAMFWLYILIIATRGMKALVTYKIPLRVLSLFCGLWLFWDVLFSPFGAQSRFVTPLYIILILNVQGRYNNPGDATRQISQMAASRRVVYANRRRVA